MGIFNKKKQNDNQPSDPFDAPELAAHRYDPRNISLGSESISTVNGHAGTEIVYYAALHQVIVHSYTASSDGSGSSTVDRLDIPESITTKNEIIAYVKSHAVGWPTYLLREDDQKIGATATADLTEAFKDDDFDETVYLCGKCGRTNPMRFAYCPGCGTKRFSLPDPDFSAAICPKCGRSHSAADAYCPHCGTKNDETTKYLAARGLLELALKIYPVHIRLENGREFTLLMHGRDRRDDALAQLQQCGLHAPGVNYSFSDWPFSSTMAGLTIYSDPGACVCELGNGVTLHLKGVKSEERGVCLYGCPNPKALDGSVLEQCRTEVVDYEQRS